MGNSGALLVKIKNFIGFGNEDYMDYEDDFEEIELNEEPISARRARTSFSRKDKVVPLNSAEAAQAKIVVLKP